MQFELDNSAAQRRKIWLVTLPVLFVPFLISFFYSMWFEGTVIGKTAYAVAKVFLIGWPIAASVFILREKILQPDPGRPRQVRASIWWGTAFGIATVALMLGLMHSSFGDVIRSHSDQVLGFVEKFTSVEWFWPFAIFISFLHSFMEEFFWRWFVFGKLRRVMPVALAILVAAIGFSAHHVVILSKFFDSNFAIPLFLGAAVGFGGAVWSWLMHRHNTLWGAWVSHMIIDLGIMWVGWELITAS